MMAASLESRLTRGSIGKMNSGAEVTDPILKIMGSRKVPGATGTSLDRYRLLLTDGEATHSFVMLATQLNHLVEDGKLPVGTVVLVKKYVCNNVKSDKCIIILLDCEILGQVDATEKSPAAKLEMAPVAAAPPVQPLSTWNGKSSAQPVAPAGPPSMVQSTPPRAALAVAARLGAAASGVSPGSDGCAARVFPISSLNPYQNRWTVRARVSQKGSVRHWNNARGEGKLFSFTLTDESGDIRVTCFKEEVDKYFESLEINQVYYVSRGTLKMANKQYNNTSHDYELTLNSDSSLVLCNDGSVDEVPKMLFSFVDINTLSKIEPGRFVDVCGVAHTTGDVETVMIRSQGKELQKREVQLVDASRGMVRLTLWGDDAINFDGSTKPVLIVKSAKVGDFNGRSLSMGHASSMLLNPPTVPEASRLRGWYDREGNEASYEAFQGGAGGAGGGGGASVWHRMDELKSGSIGTGEKPDYFTSLATCIAFKRENCLYTACPSADCNKKVVEWNGQYRCEKCNREYPNYQWRMLLQANLADSTGNQWVTMFQDTAESVLKTDAETLGQWRANGNTADAEKIFVDAAFSRFQFVLRAKMESYQDENRLKVIVVEAKALSAAEDCARLIRLVETMKQEGVCA